MRRINHQRQDAVLTVTETCLQYETSSTTSQEDEGVVLWYLWGLNPRRLERLADLKSAPLDQSGKIPAKHTQNIYTLHGPFSKPPIHPHPVSGTHLLVRQLLELLGYLQPALAQYTADLTTDNVTYLVYGRFGLRSA